MNTILIADDNQQLCSILKSAALKEGYEVLVANDGQSALDIFNQNNPSTTMTRLKIPFDSKKVTKLVRELFMP